MKTLLICTYFSLLLSVAVTAQSQQKAEKAFVKQLNHILINSKEQHWAYEGKMSVDTAFAIDKHGILSVTVRYTNDSSFVVTRTEAPVNKILRVAYDLYLILEYKTDEVNTYASDEGSNLLKETGKTNLFHIGAPVSDGYKQQEKLQELLDKLLKYYRN